MRRIAPMAALALAAFLAACGDARPRTPQGSGGACVGCHGDPARQPTALNPLLPAAPPTGAGGETSPTDRAVGEHQTHLQGAGLSTGVACGECHLVPTGTAHANGTAQAVFGSVATSGGTLTPMWGGSTCSSTYCHGNFPNGNAGYAPTWTAPDASPCGTCHGTPANAAPGGTHPSVAADGCATCHPGYTGTSVDLATHLNGQIDGGGEPTSPGSSCGGCHATIFAGMTALGPGAKAARHYLGGGDAPAPGTGAWSGAGAPATLGDPAGNYPSATCASMCHGDHPHDVGGGTTHEWNVYLDANARSGSPGAATRDDTDFDGAAANGGLCLSCHQSPVAAGRPFLSKAAFDAWAHDYVANTAGATFTWSYTLHDGGAFRRNCTKCHADRADGRPGDSTTPFGAAHYSDYPSLLAGTTNPAGAPGTFVCYECHGNGTVGQDRSGKNTQDQVVKASRHPANDDAVHDSPAELATGAFGAGLGAGVTRHASCLDCHDPHQARAGGHATPGNLAGPPLHGAWGAELTSSPASWTAPATGNFTKKTIVAGTDLEATLCFKRHSAWYGPLPTSPSGGYAGTDTAREFNPGNVGDYATAGTASWQSGETAGGFHPVLASAGSNLGAVNMANLVATSFPWRTSGARNLMTRTDCHQSDAAADPNGPHGSTAGFILRGPNTAWSNTLVATNAGMPAGVFCATCHSATWASSRFTGTQHYSRSAHRVACMSCHARIPHGGPRPGMVVAPAGAAAGVGGIIAGWDQAAPYGNPGSGLRLYIASYPTSNATAWNQGNCGCNGTGQ